MPSSKGKPTDPKLREKVKEEIKNQPNSDGGGKGQWSAWKAAKLSKEYEKKGGGYENAPGSKNEPKKGTPTPKSTGKRKAEEKQEENEETPSPNKAGDDKENSSPTENKIKQKPKANTGAKVGNGKKGGGRPKGSSTGKKEKPKVEGTRKSTRVAEKRKTEGQSDGGQQKKAKAR